MAYQRGGRGQWGNGGRQQQAPPEPTGELIATLQRPGYRDRPDAELRVTADEVEGHPFIGIRLWERSYDGSSWMPTRKGCSVRLGEAAIVSAAILEALDRLGGPPGSRSTTSRPRPPARGRVEPEAYTAGDPPPWEPRGPGTKAGPATSPDFDEFTGGGA
jgi:hypothetical protein